MFVFNLFSTAECLLCYICFGSHCVGNKHLLVCKIIDARLRIETRVGVFLYHHCSKNITNPHPHPHLSFPVYLSLPTVSAEFSSSLRHV